MKNEYTCDLDLFQDIERYQNFRKFLMPLCIQFLLLSLPAFCLYFYHRLTLPILELYVNRVMKFILFCFRILHSA